MVQGFKHGNQNIKTPATDMGTSDIMKTFKFVENLIFECFIQMTPVLATRL